MSYVTLKNGGLDYRSISEVMGKLGYQFNHATARNYTLSAMQDLIEHLSNDLQLNLSQQEIEALKHNQKFYDLIEDVVYAAYERNGSDIKQGE